MDVGALSWPGPHHDKKDECIMSTVRKSKARLGTGYVDRLKVSRATERQIARWKREDGIDDDALGPPRWIPAVNVQAIREKIGLTQEEFAQRFMLPLRTIQEWEQGRREPSEPARTLLFAISRAPKALERALKIT